MSHLITPQDRAFQRAGYHRRITISYPPDVPDRDVKIRLEVVWDERDPKATALAEMAAESLEMLALKKLLDDNSPIVVRRPR